MTITLDHIVPLPLKPKLEQHQSQVWGQSIKLESGEWVKVTAPSGTGKTTLVHLLWQLRQDFEGELWFGETSSKLLSSKQLSALRQTSFSIVFQDLRLFDQLSAFDNIELKRVMHTPSFCSKADIERMADALGVRQVLQQSAGICSYGEQQRIAIIRALMQPFDWLILDEPFSHLDEANINKAAELIATECKRRGAGLLLADLENDSHFAYTKQLVL